MTKQERIDKLKCPQCGQEKSCKMSCGYAESFSAYKNVLYWMDQLTNEHLSTLNYEVWVEANDRARKPIDTQHMTS